MKYLIKTEYPFWFIIICILLGVVFSIILYFRNKNFNFTPSIKKILFGIRFISISIIAFLLLSPLIEHLTRKIEKPIIIIAQDNSESICLNKDSSFYRTQYLKNLNGFIEQLKEKYDVKTYSFGNTVLEKDTFHFSDKLTDISLIMDELKSVYANRNIGALVLATDGIYNKGKNPLYMTDFADFPIYSMALGDTTIYKDIRISSVNHNKSAFMGNKFPVEIVVQAKKCNGKTSKLSIIKDKEILYSQILDFNSEIKTQRVFLELDANKSGLQKYNVIIDPIDGEISTLNNYQSFYIDISDKKQNILILYHAPDPDISTIKQFLEQNDNYQVSVFQAADFTGSITNYHTIILHQLPSKTYPIKKILESNKTFNIPILYILGEKSDIAAFNLQLTGLQIITNNKNSLNEARPVINSAFPLFSIEHDLVEITDDLPPLDAPFGNYKTAKSTNTLFFQNINAVPTQIPLILFNNTNNTKIAVIAGTGIWKWKLMNYQKNQNYDIIQNLIKKTIQYLSVTSEKGLFRISNTTRFNEYEQIEFNAEVYNQSDELINTPEVTMNIYNKENKIYPFTFNKTSNAYHLNSGIMPAGEYKYEGKVKIGDSTYTKKGFFYIIALNKESITTEANHKLLYNIAHNNNGQLYYPSQFDLLLKEINKRDDIKSVSYNQKQYIDLINLFWVFVIILILLSSEWFLRKWTGNY